MVKRLSQSERGGPWATDARLALYRLVALVISAYSRLLMHWHVFVRQGRGKNGL